MVTPFNLALCLQRLLSCLNSLISVYHSGVLYFCHPLDGWLMLGGRWGRNYFSVLVTCVLNRYGLTARFIMAVNERSTTQSLLFWTSLHWKWVTYMIKGLHNTTSDMKMWHVWIKTPVATWFRDRHTGKRIKEVVLAGQSLSCNCASVSCGRILGCGWKMIVFNQWCSDYLVSRQNDLRYFSICFL